jgi:hypothetical protein
LVNAILGLNLKRYLILKMNKKILKKFGFAKDQDGIINRYLRETESWSAHLNNTKNFILKAASGKSQLKVCILGSGWLLDIPYLELSETFQQVLLVDIKHPTQIVHKLNKYPNFKLIEADITGLIEPVYNILVENKKNNIRIDLCLVKPVYSEILLHEIEQSDLIVSVNLLNQLDILICDYILKSKQYSVEEIVMFRKYIQNNHIELLPKNKSALITDFEELNLDKNKQVVGRKKLVYLNFPENMPCLRWTWEFDLQKTYRKNLQTVFKVMAIEL